MTNTLHATDFHRRSNTGITFAINGLIEQALRYLPKGSGASLISVAPKDVEPPNGTYSITVPMSKLPFASAWAYAPAYQSACQTIIRERHITAVHVHGVWLHPHYAAVQAASNLGVPIVLTNHGHFEHWALREHKGLKKRFYLALMRSRMFEKIKVFHAITPPNRAMLHELFPSAPIELIPNSIDIEAADRINLGKSRDSTLEPYILFVGRLAPQKGLDLLIEAFGHAALPHNWKLLIAGPEESHAYANYLRQLIDRSPRADRIQLLGPVWDETQKYRLMRDAWLVAVPSRSEVVALVNLEASACATPTITTVVTGLDDWEEGGGSLVEATPREVAFALERASRWSDSERKERGQASRRLVEQRYSTRVTGPLWAGLYRSFGT